MSTIDLGYQAKLCSIMSCNTIIKRFTVLNRTFFSFFCVEHYHNFYDLR